MPPLFFDCIKFEFLVCGQPGVYQGDLMQMHH